MNTTTSNASLVIHPDDPEWFPDKPEKIISLLENIGLIADEIQNEEQSYLVGDKFLELIAFLGCSPNINLSPQDNPDKYCFVRLITNDTVTALISNHTHAPHCPQCKKSEKNWLNKLTPATLHCSACGQTCPPWHFNWRKSAGFGRFFIEVTEVYPREAIPQPALLAALERQHEEAWNYFYLHA